MSDPEAVFNQVESTYEWVKQKRGQMPTVDEVALEVTGWGIRQENRYASDGQYQVEYVYLLAALHEVKQLRKTSEPTSE